MRGSIVKRTGKATKDGKPIEQYYIVYDAGLKWDEKKGQHVQLAEVGEGDATE